MAEFILGVIVGGFVVQGIWEIRQRRRPAGGDQSFKPNAP